MAESYAGKIRRKSLKKQHIVDVAAGRSPADLVLKNAVYLNVFSNELCRGRYCRGRGSDRRHGLLLRPSGVRHGRAYRPAGLY